MDKFVPFLMSPFSAAVTIQKRVQGTVRRELSRRGVLTKHEQELAIRREQMTLDHIELHRQCCCCLKEVKDRDSDELQRIQRVDLDAYSKLFKKPMRGYICKTCAAVIEVRKKMKKEKRNRREVTKREPLPMHMRAALQRIGCAGCNNATSTCVHVSTASTFCSECYRKGKKLLSDVRKLRDGFSTLERIEIMDILRVKYVPLPKRRHGPQPMTLFHATEDLFVTQPPELDALMGEVSVAAEMSATHSLNDSTMLSLNASASFGGGDNCPSAANVAAAAAAAAAIRQRQPTRSVQFSAAVFCDRTSSRHAKAGGSGNGGLRYADHLSDHADLFGGRTWENPPGLFAECWLGDSLSSIHPVIPQLHATTDVELQPLAPVGEVLELGAGDVGRVRTAFRRWMAFRDEVTGRRECEHASLAAMLGAKRVATPSPSPSSSSPPPIAEAEPEAAQGHESRPTSAASTRRSSVTSEASSRHRDPQHAAAMPDDRPSQANAANPSPPLPMEPRSYPEGDAMDLWTPSTTSPVPFRDATVSPSTLLLRKGGGADAEEEGPIYGDADQGHHRHNNGDGDGVHAGARRQSERRYDDFTQRHLGVGGEDGGPGPLAGDDSSRGSSPTTASLLDGDNSRLGDEVSGLYETMQSPRPKDQKSSRSQSPESDASEPYEAMPRTPPPAEATCDEDHEAPTTSRGRLDALRATLAATKAGAAHLAAGTASNVSGRVTQSQIGNSALGLPAAPPRRRMSIEGDNPEGTQNTLSRMDALRKAVSQQRAQCLTGTRSNVSKAEDTASEAERAALMPMASPLIPKMSLSEVARQQPGGVGRVGSDVGSDTGSRLEALRQSMASARANAAKMVGSSSAVGSATSPRPSPRPSPRGVAPTSPTHSDAPSNVSRLEQLRISMAAAKARAAALDGASHVGDDGEVGSQTRPEDSASNVAVMRRLRARTDEEPSARQPSVEEDDSPSPSDKPSERMAAMRRQMAQAKERQAKARQGEDAKED